MLIKELFEGAIENEQIDLQALIMLTVFEKKVLTLQDPVEKLSIYFDDRHKEKMNKHLTMYKQKVDLKYKPGVYEVLVHQKNGYRTIYILADSEKQAESYVKSRHYKSTKVRQLDNDLLMTLFSRENGEINFTVKELRDRQDRIPAFLGGF